MPINRDVTRLTEAYQEISPGVVRWIDGDLEEAPAEIIVCKCRLFRRSRSQPQGITEFTSITQSSEKTLRAAFFQATAGLKRQRQVIGEDLAAAWVGSDVKKVKGFDPNDPFFSAYVGDYVVALSPAHPAYELVNTPETLEANLKFMVPDARDKWDELITDCW